jgi:hypothetical protein
VGAQSSLHRQYALHGVQLESSAQQFRHVGFDNRSKPALATFFSFCFHFLFSVNVICEELNFA